MVSRSLPEGLGFFDQAAHPWLFSRMGCHHNRLDSPSSDGQDTLLSRREGFDHFSFVPYKEWEEPILRELVPGVQLCLYHIGIRRPVPLVLGNSLWSEERNAEV